MLKFIKEELAANANLPTDKQRQIIMLMHIFPGLNYYNKNKNGTLDISPF